MMHQKFLYSLSEGHTMFIDGSPQFIDLFVCVYTFLNLYLGNRTT
jgi:hypothetical protein